MDPIAFIRAGPANTMQTVPSTTSTITNMTARLLFIAQPSNIQDRYPMPANSPISRQCSYVGQRFAHAQSGGLGGGRQSGQSRTQ